MLPLSPYLKDTLEKLEQDFLASNLPEGKYIKTPASAKWYKVRQPCFEDKLQEFNSVFAKICISPDPFGQNLMGKVPLQVLQELEHQARQNLSTIKYASPFAKTASTCNTTMEKCQDSLKSLVCLSKSLAHILQRGLYTIGNTGLLRCEAEMTLLQPHLGDSRSKLRNSPFWPTPLFNSQLVKDGKDFLLKKAPLKIHRVLDPIKISPFVIPTTIRKEAPTGNASMGATPPKAVTNRFPQVGGN